MNFIRSISLMIFFGCAISTIPMHVFAQEVPEANSQGDLSAHIMSPMDQARSGDPESPEQVPLPAPSFSIFNWISSIITEYPIISTAVGLGALALGIGLFLKLKKSKKIISNINPLFTRQSNLNQDIQICEIPLKGKTFEVRDITIAQLPVLQQKGLSCGYHSLKNGILIAQSLLNNDKNLNSQLLDDQTAEDLFAYSNVTSYLFGLVNWDVSGGKWRKYVRKSFASKPGNHNSHVDDISSAALESLIQYEKKNQLLYNKKFNFDMYAIDDISIIGAPIDIVPTNVINKDNLQSYDFVTPEVKQGLEKARLNNIPYVGVFLINTGKEYMDSTGKIGGSQGNHWFTVVLYATGSKHTYVVTDSIGSTRIPYDSVTADGRLKRLINTIEGQDILF